MIGFQPRSGLIRVTHQRRVHESRPDLVVCVDAVRFAMTQLRLCGLVHAVAFKPPITQKHESPLLPEFTFSNLP